MPEETTATDTKPVATKTPIVQKKLKGVNRNFNKEKIIHHDCFKLEPAQLQKNMSWIKSEPRYERFEHCHTFHSYDSQGRKQVYSTPIGGHFHEIEFKEHADGSVTAKCISGPLKWGVVYDEDLERKIKKPVPVNPRDKHTHKTTYIHSEQLVKRKHNAEASKLTTAQAQLTTPPEGTQV